MRYVDKGLVLGAFMLLPATAWGGHPLITDDAGTQGKGNFQLEVNWQYDADRERTDGTTLKSEAGQVATTLSFGLTGDADLVLSLPYVGGRQKEDGVTVYKENGVSDATLELKWRFFDKDGLALALKPGLRLPTGKEEKGLGAGKTGYHAFVICSKEIDPWSFHVNVGYIGNENKADEEKRIWHASLAATYEVIGNLKIVGNIGIEQNPVKAENQDPAFLIGGVIYSLSESFDIDFGAKYGLTSPETDLSLMAGIAYRF